MTKDVIDSVIEAQAVALSAKNQEIKELADRLKTAEEQIEKLQNKVNAGLYQNLIDQIQELAVDALDAALMGKEVEYRADLGTHGDTVNICDSREARNIQLHRVEITKHDVTLQSTAMGRQLRAQVDSTIQDLVDKLSALEYQRFVFRRLPRPLPGTGAVFSTVDNKYGMRVIAYYNPNMLCNTLMIDVLCGGTT